MHSNTLALIPLASFLGLTSALCAPGNFLDLSVWELELPIGTQGNPTTIKSSALQGCDGYQDPDHQYFFTETTDSKTVMKAPSYPSSNCVKYGASNHCRTEFHEVIRGTDNNAVSWSPSDTNHLLVDMIGESGAYNCIGQVFIADGNSDHNKPLAEVYYASNGNIQVGVEAGLSGNSQGDPIFVANRPQGTRFTYELRYDNNVLEMKVDDGDFVNLGPPTNPSGAFFKFGSYNQGGDEADIHLYNITIVH